MNGRGRDGGEGQEPMAGEDLVSLLYGELDADEAARASARVASDPAMSARLGEMRRVRELFSSLDEEEPPSRLTAQLMAEAARAAPQARRAAGPAEAGLWARLVSWLQPLVQRPALAAAASLVLVAGVAGVLYMKKGDELTSTAPPASRESEADSEASAAPTGTAAPEPSPVTAATPSETLAAGEEQPEQGVAEGDADSSDRTIEPAKPSPGGSKMSKRRRGDSYGSNEKKLDAPQQKNGLKSGTVLGLSEQEMVPRDQTGAEGGAANSAADTKPAAPAPQPSAEPPAQAPKSDGKAPSRPSVNELHQRAVDAAMDRRCAEVKILAGQVRASDSAYYAKNFAGDKRLQSCLSSPSRAPAKK